MTVLYFLEENLFYVERTTLTLCLNKCLIEVSAEQWLRQVPEIFLEQCCYIMWAVILSKTDVLSTVKFLTKLECQQAAK